VELVLAFFPSLGTQLQIANKEANNCSGLEKALTMAAGARVMLRTIGREDGLVNGVMGTILGF